MPPKPQNPAGAIPWAVGTDTTALALTDKEKLSGTNVALLTLGILVKFIGTTNSLACSPVCPFIELILNFILRVVVPHRS